MKTSQQWIKDIMFEIIRLMERENYSGDLCTEGYKYTINGAIDNYSQIYFDQKHQKNINLFHKYKNFDDGIYMNVLWSQEALNLLKAMMIDYKKLDRAQKVKVTKALNEELHGEHMTPQSYTRYKLNSLLGQNLNDSNLREAINNAFHDAKLCITTKKESMILDGKDCNFTKEIINDFLSTYKKNHTLIKPLEEDIINLTGKSLKSSGYGSIRLYVLYQNGVRFIDSNGNEKTLDECFDYLNDGNYNIK